MAKKISAIVSLSIIGVLIIATLIMANVKVSFGVKCATPNMVTVSYSSGANKFVEGEQSNKIVSLLADASKENSLTAMFTGKLFDKAGITTYTNNSTNSIPKSNETFYVTFSYDNPQKLMDGNKEYKDKDGKVYYYKKLVFAVAKTDSHTVAKVYIVPSYKPNSDDVYNEGGYSKYYTVNANYSALYNYLVEEGFNN